MFLALLAAAALGSFPIHPVASLYPAPPLGQPGGDIVEWRVLPTIDDLHAAYPAGEQGRGSVNLSRDVMADGRLHDCKVTSQAPASAAFAGAALNFVRSFRMAEPYVAVARRTGAKVLVALAFVKPGEEWKAVPPDRCLPPLCSFTPAAPPAPKPS